MSEGAIGCAVIIVAVVLLGTLVYSCNRANEAYDLASHALESR